jgi:hypothetical protein
MPPDKFRIQETLYKSSLFAELPDEELNSLAEEYHFYYPEDGERVIEQGEEAEYFYLIYRGSVELLWNDGAEEYSLAVLGPGDYFGEEGLLKKKVYQVSAEVHGFTALIEINKEQFTWLVRKYPEVKEALEMIAKTQEMAKKMDFEWLGEDETVYLIARRHIFIFLFKFMGPLIFVLSAFLLGWWGVLMGLSLFWILAGVSLVVGSLWGVWVFLDWRNDYYILTNQRIVWYEQVIFLYVNRQEAPLYAILNMDVLTTQLGRIIGYGDVRLRTFTGLITLDHISNPENVLHLLTELRERAIQEQEAAAGEEINEAVLQAVGTVPPPPPGLPARPWRKKSETKLKMPPIWQDFVLMRVEQGRVITYRKHWLVLLFQTWIPALLMAVVVGLSFVGLFNFWTLFGMFLVPFFWWLYQYFDWRNDIFRLTDDKIYDIDRKPLGTEHSKEAPLDSILSLEVERIGLLGVLFNFGNVIIDVSGTKFVFDDIFNPAQAQQDIFGRIDLRRRRKQEEQERKERQRLMKWFKIYNDETRP